MPIWRLIAYPYASDQRTRGTRIIPAGLAQAGPFFVARTGFAMGPGCDYVQCIIGHAIQQAPVTERCVCSRLYGRGEHTMQLPKTFDAETVAMMGRVCYDAWWELKSLNAYPSTAAEENVRSLVALRVMEAVARG